MPLELELDMEPAPETPPPAALRPTAGAAAAAVQGDHDDIGGLDDFDDELNDVAGFDLQAHEPASSQRSSRARMSSPASQPGVPSSRRGIQVRSHRRAPLGTAQVAVSCMLCLTLVVLVPYLQPPIIQVVESWLPSVPFVPYIVIGVALFACWAPITARALRDNLWGLYGASLGLLILFIAASLIVTSSISGSLTTMAFRKLMPYVVPLATSLVLLGLAWCGLGKAKHEGFTTKRRLYGLLLLLVSLAGVVLAIRVARFDLAIPRIDAPTMPTWW